MHSDKGRYYARSSAMERRVRLLMSAFILVVGAAMVDRFPSVSAGCYKMRVINYGSHQMRALFSAAGCAGAVDMKDVVCADRFVSPGHVAEYDFNWGTSCPRIWVKKSGRGTEAYTLFVWRRKNGFTDNAREESGGASYLRCKTPECGGNKGLHVRFNSYGDVVLKDRRRNLLRGIDGYDNSTMVVADDDELNDGCDDGGEWHMVGTNETLPW